MPDKFTEFMYPLASGRIISGKYGVTDDPCTMTVECDGDRKDDELTIEECIGFCCVMAGVWKCFAEQWYHSMLRTEDEFDA